MFLTNLEVNAMKLKCIVLCLLICILLFGCNKNKEMEVLLSGVSDGVGAISCETEYDALWHMGLHEDKSAKNQMKITVDNMEVTGIYQHSLVGRNDNYKTHTYMTEDRSIDFRIIDGTKQIVAYSNRENAKINEDAAFITEAEAIEKAKEVLIEYGNVSNLEVYDISTEPMDNTKGYQITFSKELCGYETGEIAFIQITGEGKIHYFQLFMIGKMSDDIVITKDRAEIEAAVMAKAQELYQAQEQELPDDQKPTSVEFLIQRAVLTLDEEDKPILVYKVDIVKNFKDEYASHTITDVIELIVTNIS